MENLPVTKGSFDSSWDSLKGYKSPDWFRDAKLGFWAHWGPQAVPEAGDWYARNMYIEGHEQYKYHLEHYGHPSEFGFKDILPLWKAEKFDPDALIRLYKNAGAKYFVALANHHDNFDCWNSTYHSWNSVNMGPKKDIVGMWKEAALKHGLRFGVTEHLERAYSWFNTNKGSDKEGPYAAVPYDGANPQYADYYFEKHDDTSHAYPFHPSEAWQREWYMRTKDLVEQYDPDLLYTDGGIPFGEVGRAMIANFYNNNIKTHNGKLEAVYNLKDRHLDAEREKSIRGEYQDGVGVQCVERGVVDDILQEPWQTDTCIGDWFYNRFIQYKTITSVVHMLIDIVSKNGNMLLNIPLKADGTPDNAAISFLEGFGEWMAVHGEAIYGTRPWKIFAEGPTRASSGTLGETNSFNYTEMDFRFTQKGDILYAFVMQWPKDGKSVIQCLAHGKERPVTKVELLGCRKELDWIQTDEGLIVHLPVEIPNEHAGTFKIQFA